MMLAPPRAPTEGVRGLCAGTVYFLCGVSFRDTPRNRNGKAVRHDRLRTFQWAIRDGVTVVPNYVRRRAKHLPNPPYV